ncbi:MAG: class I SAM-dependent methyltransferase [Caulobacterales bacterium]
MRAIDAIQGRDNPGSLANRFRRARSRKVMALIERIFAEKGGVRIIDLGGEPEYWALFDTAALEAAKAEILIVNPTPQASPGPLFRTEVGDACDLHQYADGNFDLAHSNSVIEHVGDWDRVEAFAGEVRRLAPSYYVQTPYFGFPIEPHFTSVGFHWRSEQSRARQLMRRTHGFMAAPAQDMGEAMRMVQSARLLGKAQFRHLFPDARHLDERVLGLTKSLIAIREGTQPLPVG